MSLFVNPIDILVEASDIDLSTTNNIIAEGIVNEFAEQCSNIPMIGYDTIIYTEEVVPVFEVKGDYRCKAVVELENVVKYMDYRNIDNITEALSNIASYYNLDEDDIGVVIESEEELNSIITEAKKSAKKDKNKLNLIAKASDTLKGFKDHKIKVFKKPIMPKSKRKKKDKKDDEE